eukprot:g11626.t1
MRVRSAVRRMCRDCYVVKKKRVVYIRCKSVKKHKQRQGFHTQAGGVSAFEGDGEGPGSHLHGFGACEHPQMPEVAAPWRAAPLTTGSAETLAGLPWLPAWASVPAAASAVPETTEAAPSALTSQRRTELGTAAVSAFSPLRTLGGWLMSIYVFSGVGKKTGP